MCLLHGNQRASTIFHFLQRNLYFSVPHCDLQISDHFQKGQLCYNWLKHLDVSNRSNMEEEEQFENIDLNDDNICSVCKLETETGTLSFCHVCFELNLEGKERQRKNPGPARSKKNPRPSCPSL